METIVVEQQNRVGIIYLNRQEFLNAFDDLMGYESDDLLNTTGILTELYMIKGFPI